MAQKKKKKKGKKNRSWKRKLSLERLLLPEYQRDDGGLNVKLCSPPSSRANQDEGPGNVRKLLVPSSLDFVCWHWTDPFYTQRPARGRRYQAVDGRDWTARLAKSRLGERTGILSSQTSQTFKSKSSQSSCGETVTTSFICEPLVQRHLTGSAPGLVFLFSRPPALIGCAL